jgi:hypothetical protein
LWFRDFKEYIIEPPVPDPVLHISGQFSINKSLNESSSKSDLVLPT